MKSITLNFLFFASNQTKLKQTLYWAHYLSHFCLKARSFFAQDKFAA
ncbi:hypothetical protein VCNHCC008D_002872 [Vibrio cholerae O1 str. NHCC-008D]|nr:hypothetical protein VCNHCC008D_002872 [Vibrio cholerae O1 str. NHCC-008D]